MIPGSANPLLLAPAAGGYQVQRSLRFNSSDSAFCSRTPAVAGNRKTWTWAGWVKRSKLGTTQGLFGSVNSATQQRFEFISDKLYWVWAQGTVALNTDAVFRDASAWYHIVLASDTDNATAANRIKIYVNGVAQTLSGTAVSPGEQWDINTTIQHRIGNFNDGGSGNDWFDGYLADIHFIDGQALTPSSFTEVSATTGQLIPKAYSGSFGTNGFWLKFSDNSAATAAALGNDYSGNNNDWTPNNLSVTAGAGNDSLVDTPTSFGTDTGVGGEVRGNYCTLNPLDNGGITLANGNLDSTYAGGLTWKAVRSTIGVSAGKYYWEFTSTSNVDSNNGPMVGLSKLGSPIPSYPGFTADSWGYNANGGSKFNNATGTAYGAGYTNGDVIGVAFDADNGTLTFYKNNVSQSTAFTGLTSGPYAPAVGFFGTSSGVMNFGQRAFAYTAPSGFKALCDTNLPAPLTAKGNTLMDVALYTGNGSTQTISGLNFSPDLVWLKSRSGAFNHRLVDQVQGNTSTLASNLTTAAVDCSSDFTGFTASGFSVSQTASFELNNISHTYVAWAWDAGTSTVSNTSGSITSQVRANVSAGFSVVTYTGTGANATVGHGLGVAPAMVIIKSRTTSDFWVVGHTSLGFTTDNYMRLNATAASGAGGGVAWNNTAPTSTVVHIGSSSVLNGNGNNLVMYAWAPVVGYSSFGSFAGNGSSDGPFIYTGMRPKWLLVKKAVGGTSDWWVWDVARDTYNVADSILYPNIADAEVTDASVFGYDILSNGFKVRNANATVNNAAHTYIYAAFAENPFQYARAR